MRETDPVKMPHQIPTAANASAEYSMGDLLRARRLELGWSLTDVANGLRIRQSYLSALEEGRLDQLPASVYAVGFLRSYAEALGLDADSLVKGFQILPARQGAEKATIALPQSSAERRAPLTIYAALGLALVICAYVAHYHYAGKNVAFVNHNDVPAYHEPTAPTEQPHSRQAASPLRQKTADRLASSTSEALKPSVPNAAVASDVSGQASDNRPTSPPAAGEKGEIQLGIVPLHNAKKTIFAAVTPLESLTTNRLVDQTSSSVLMQNQPVDASKDPVITLHASSDSWVRIIDRDGKEQFSGVLRAGKSWQGAAGLSPFKMTFGNAGALVLQYAGVSTAPLGKVGQVEHDVVVTPQTISDKGFKAPSTVNGVPASAHVLTKSAQVRRSRHRDNRGNPETDVLNSRQLNNLKHPL